METTAIINVSGYRFVHVEDPHALQGALKRQLPATGVKGAVLLAEEGVNITLAGTGEQVNAAITCMEQYPELKGIWLKQCYSQSVPHKRLKIRVRAEIIAFDSPDGDPLHSDAPSMAPHTLDQWLDEQRDFTLLDTRNDYEVESGTFEQAVHLDIKHFRHFKEAIYRAVEAGTLDKTQPVVTFCTGCIRCEKAAPWLLSEGFSEVYQVEGGVINYLQQSRATHWQGNCFVFDNRVEINRDLEPTGAGLCEYCQLAVPAGTDCQCQLGVHYHATYTLD